MHLLDIILTPRNSKATLRAQSHDDISTYIVILKRFTESGGSTAAVWQRSDVETKGIVATLDDATGFHIIISAKTASNARAKMRVQLNIGEHQFDGLISIPPDDSVGWSVVMKEEVVTVLHAPEAGQLFGVAGMSELQQWP